jgi:hypothetical protein
MTGFHSVAAPSISDTSPSSSFESSATTESNEARVPSATPSSQTTIASEKPDLSGDLEEAQRRSMSQEQQTDLTSFAVSSLSAKRKRSISVLNVKRAECAEVARGGSLVVSSTALPPLRISLSFDGEAMVRKDDEKTPSPPKPRDSVRISMSADGEALIRTGNEASPSSIKGRMGLLHTRRNRFGSLRRTSSAITLGTTGTVTENTGKAFGRSRDARTWELYCDTDARSALSASSTPVQGGCGASSVSLLRFQNNKAHREKSESGNRNILRPRSDLLNAVTVSRQPSEQKRKKLARATSSLARLQSGQNLPKSSDDIKDSKYVAINKTGDGIEFDSGDSDKENWIPGTQASYARRQGSSGQRSHAILQTSHNLMCDASSTQSARLNSKASKDSQSPAAAADKENRRHIPEGEDDEEISSFMTGSSGPSQNEDLDCIQGLLSLSRGAWS